MAQLGPAGTDYVSEYQDQLVDELKDKSLPGPPATIDIKDYLDSLGVENYFTTEVGRAPYTTSGLFGKIAQCQQGRDERNFQRSCDHYFDSDGVRDAKFRGTPYEWKALGYISYDGDHPDNKCGGADYPLICYNKLDDPVFCCTGGKGRTVLQRNHPNQVTGLPISLTCSDETKNFGSNVCDDVMTQACDIPKMYEQYLKDGTFGGGRCDLWARTRIEDFGHGLEGVLGGCENPESTDCGNPSLAALDPFHSVMKQYCNDPDRLARESPHDSVDNPQVCHSWCRSNPGQCDQAMVQFCDAHIAEKCADDSSEYAACGDLVIDPFCTCYFYSQRGMTQPECFSAICKTGRGSLGKAIPGKGPGYRTATMLPPGQATTDNCGAYCDNSVEIIGNVIIEGGIRQSCDIDIDSTQTQEVDRRVNSTTNVNNQVDTSAETGFKDILKQAGLLDEQGNATIGFILILVFIILIVIIALVFNQRKNQDPYRYYRR